MRRLKLIAAVATVLALLAVPTLALAQDAPANPTDPHDLAIKLAAFFPWVVLVSSLFLSPRHCDAVKKLVPGVVSLVVAIVYFVLQGWPGLGAQVITGIGALSALAITTYEPISALIFLITGGRQTLNSVTGPGLPVGPTDDEDVPA